MSHTTPTTPDHLTTSPTRFRRTRIAVSVVFGVVALLLVVLWVRSYSWSEKFVWCFSPGHYFLCHSVDGHWFLHLCDFPPQQIIPPREPIKTFAFRTRRPTHEDLAAVTNRVMMHAGFGAYYSPELKFLAAPYWFVFLISIAAGTCGVFPLPWTLSRFSLRTMLIATTLVGLTLGLIAWTSS